jgi:hypothetical protein
LRRKSTFYKWAMDVVHFFTAVIDMWTEKSSLKRMFRQGYWFLKKEYNNIIFLMFEPCEYHLKILVQSVTCIILQR